MREILEEERGSSVIVAALLLLAIFSVAYGAYVSSKVPQEFTREEKNQMSKVQNRFTEIQNKIQNMSEGETKRISIPMSVDLSSSYLEGPSIAGTLTLKTYTSVDTWRDASYIDPAETETGDVWFAPDNGMVQSGKNYSDEIHVNSSENKIGSYKLVITHNENILEVNVNRGENGVEPGEDGFVDSVNVEPGEIIIEGSSTNGTGPGENLHLLTIHWKTVGVMKTKLNLNAENLEDSGENTIGTPNGINGERIVPVIYENQEEISFNKQNGYYVDQKYVYEHGAVILVQSESSQILSKPILLETEKLDSNKLEVEIQKISLLGSSSEEIVSTGTATVSLTKKNTITREGLANNILMEINTEYPQAWEDYLEQKIEELDRENIEAELSQNQNQISLTVKGIKGSSSENNDIIYTLKHQEIQVDIF